MEEELNDLAGFSPSTRAASSKSAALRCSMKKKSQSEGVSIPGGDSVSVVTDGSILTEGAKARAQEDLKDEGGDGSKEASKPWFCYRLMLAGMLAAFVCIACFMASCQSFRYESWDDGVQYYGIRGVTDSVTGRCVDWQTQEFIDWNTDWTSVRLPSLFIMGIAGITFVVGIAIAWVVYGLILKWKRERNNRKVRVDSLPSDALCGPIGPGVIIGVCLIGAGVLVFATIMGNCANLPPAGFDRGLRCNLYTWSSLALTSSFALCSMGGTLAFFLKCCCNRCCCTTYLRKQLVEP